MNLSDLNGVEIFVAENGFIVRKPDQFGATDGGTLYVAENKQKLAQLIDSLLNANPVP